MLSVQYKIGHSVGWEHAVNPQSFHNPHARAVGPTPAWRDGFDQGVSDGQLYLKLMGEGSIPRMEIP